MALVPGSDFGNVTGGNVYGDVWTWTALDADSKLMVSWLVGERDAGYAMEFMSGVAKQLTVHVQLTTDGLKAYLTAVEDAFGCEIDYAQLVKIYGVSPEGEKRYSPAECLGCEKHPVTGFPDPKHVSTSYVERQSLTMSGAPLHSTYKCLLQESRELGGGGCPALHVVQLRAGASDLAGDSSDGSGDCGSRLDGRGDSLPDRLMKLCNLCCCGQFSVDVYIRP